MFNDVSQPVVVFQAFSIVFVGCVFQNINGVVPILDMTPSFSATWEDQSEGDHVFNGTVLAFRGCQFKKLQLEVTEPPGALITFFYLDGRTEITGCQFTDSYIVEAHFGFVYTVPSSSSFMLIEAPVEIVDSRFSNILLGSGAVVAILNDPMDQCIYCTVALTRVVFKQSTARHGCVRVSASGDQVVPVFHANVVLTDVTFHTNVAFHHGVLFLEDEPVTCIGCVFHRNSYENNEVADTDRGMSPTSVLFQSSRVTSLHSANFINCTFADFEDTGVLGGIQLVTVMISGAARPAFDNCTFTLGPSSRFAVAVTGASRPLFAGCTFATPPNGGPSDLRGIWIEEGAAPTFTDCTFLATVGWPYYDFPLERNRTSFPRAAEVVILEGFSSATFIDCLFETHGKPSVGDVNFYGGVVALRLAGASSLRCQRCTFRSFNSSSAVWATFDGADDGSLRGAVESPPREFQGCTFSSEQALDYVVSAQGGALGILDSTFTNVSLRETFPFTWHNRVSYTGVVAFSLVRGGFLRNVLFVPAAVPAPGASRTSDVIMDDSIVTMSSSLTSGVIVLGNSSVLQASLTSLFSRRDPPARPALLCDPASGRPKIAGSLIASPGVIAGSGCAAGPSSNGSLANLTDRLPIRIGRYSAVALTPTVYLAPGAAGGVVFAVEDWMSGLNVTLVAATTPADPAFRAALSNITLVLSRLAQPAPLGAGVGAGTSPAGAVAASWRATAAAGIVVTHEDPMFRSAPEYTVDVIAPDGLPQPPEAFVTAALRIRAVPTTISAKMCQLTMGKALWGFALTGHRLETSVKVRDLLGLTQLARDFDSSLVLALTDPAGAHPLPPVTRSTDTELATQFKPHRPGPLVVRLSVDGGRTFTTIGRVTVYWVGWAYVVAALVLVLTAGAVALCVNRRWARLHRRVVQQLERQVLRIAEYEEWERAMANSEVSELSWAGLGDSLPELASASVELAGVPQFEFGEIEMHLHPKNRLSKGAFGEVFRCRWRGQDVAVKRMFVPDPAKGPAVRDAFIREVNFLHNADHPNILPAYGACYMLPNLCFISRLMEKGSLYRVLHNPDEAAHLHLARRVEIALQLARGVAYLHTSEPPIVHRDLKSVNVLCGLNYSVRIADFGLARTLLRDHLDTTHQGGTPAWMAPEQLRGEPISEKADVYACGVLLWEIFSVSGRLPWEGKAYVDIVRCVGLQRERLDLSEILVSGNGAGYLPPGPAQPGRAGAPDAAPVPANPAHAKMLLSEERSEHSSALLLTNMTSFGGPASADAPQLPPYVESHVRAEVAKLVSRCFRELPSDRPEAQELAETLGSLKDFISLEEDKRSR